MQFLDRKVSTLANFCTDNVKDRSFDPLQSSKKNSTFFFIKWPVSWPNFRRWNWFRYHLCYRPPCGKVMFSVVSVILCSHVTTTHGALDLTVQGQPSQFPTLDMGPHCTRTPPISRGHGTLPVQGPPPPTCSNLFIMKFKCLATGWFASYLNALLFYKGQSCLFRSWKID